MGLAQRKVTYRLYPTKRQDAALFEHLRLHQQLYNAALEQRINAWRVQRHSVTFAEQCRDNTVLRRECPEFSALNAQSAQVTLKRLDHGFQAFFRRVKTGQTPGFPRFKALARFKGWGYKTHGDGWRLEAGENGKHGRMRLMGIGTVKLRGKARNQGLPKTCEIIREQGRWYASITLNCEPQRSRGSEAIGLDWGEETLATIAYEDGRSKRLENPGLLKNNLGQLAKLQRELAGAALVFT
jgi:putative transposase